MSSERNIVLVAPQFDVTCFVTIPYLRHLAGDKGITFHLIHATSKADGGYDIAPDSEPVAASSMIAKSCGVSLHGTLYVVLNGGTPPVLWRVGAVDGDGKISVSKRSMLRFDDRLLRPVPAPLATLDLTECGSCWLKQIEPEKTAIVLGVLRDDLKGDTYHLARLRAGMFENVKRKPASTLHDEWTRNSTDIFDWRTLRGLPATEADGARK